MREATVVIPVYNDWDSLRELLCELDRVLSDQYRLHAVLVDDASTQPKPGDLVGGDLSVFSSIVCLRLKVNIGHQRAIAAALSWIGATENTRAVIVMDGDGEDKPGDVPGLLKVFFETGGETAVFAERTRRSESVLFQAFYLLYRWLHWLMIGLKVKIGNFSVIPPGCVEGLIVSNYLWYHYAAAVVRIRVPFVTMQTTRGHRYKGRSKMSFIALVRHGISAIAVHSEVLSVRLLIASVIVTLIGLASLVALVWIRFFTLWAIPGWATTASGLIAILLLQVLSLAFTFAMQSVSIHANTSFLPVRDCPAFVQGVQRVSLTREEKCWSGKV